VLVTEFIPEDLIMLPNFQLFRRQKKGVRKLACGAAAEVAGGDAGPCSPHQGISGPAIKHWIPPFESHGESAQACFSLHLLISILGMD
jgi:hypothetical protein